MPLDETTLTAMRRVKKLSFTDEEQLERERLAQQILFDHPENPAKKGNGSYARSFKLAAKKRRAQQSARL